MTEERRRDVCKHLNKVLEEHRTAVRNVRRDGNDASRSSPRRRRSARTRRSGPREVQKMTDEEIRRMEELSTRRKRK